MGVLLVFYKLKQANFDLDTFLKQEVNTDENQELEYDQPFWVNYEDEEIIGSLEI